MLGVSSWRELLDKLLPLNRVHVGPDTALGFRLLAEHYPNTLLFGYPSGESQNHWIVPPQWQVEAGRLTGPDGTVIADYAEHPLHLWTYAPNFKGTVSLEQLAEHLLSDPERPEAISYHFRNQYRHWEPQWGFSIAHQVRQSLPDGDYEVDIRTRFEPGKLEMVEQLHAGRSTDAVLFIGHFDHPAMANDGLVGCLAGHEALTRLGSRSTRLSYRMLSTIEIVGSVFYTARHGSVKDIREAMFLASAGADSPLVYAQSASGKAYVDRIMGHLLNHHPHPSKVAAFRQGGLGNDEVAFDVYGVDIPCGSLMRYPLPHYHTHLDDRSSVVEHQFETYVQLILELIEVCERNSRLVPQFNGLPCLSNPSLDLYLSPPRVSNISEPPNRATQRLFEQCKSEVSAQRCQALMTLVPALANGRSTVLDLAERAAVPFAVADAYTDMWVEKVY